MMLLSRLLGFFSAVNHDDIMIQKLHLVYHFIIKEKNLQNPLD